MLTPAQINFQARLHRANMQQHLYASLYADGLRDEVLSSIPLKQRQRIWKPIVNSIMRDANVRITDTDRDGDQRVVWEWVGYIDEGVDATPKMSERKKMDGGGGTPLSAAASTLKSAFLQSLLGRSNHGTPVSAAHSPAASPSIARPRQP